MALRKINSEFCRERNIVDLKIAEYHYKTLERKRKSTEKYFKEVDFNKLKLGKTYFLCIKYQYETVNSITDSVLIIKKDNYWFNPIPNNDIEIIENEMKNIKDIDELMDYVNSKSIRFNDL